jgi:hypothetical protein
MVSSSSGRVAATTKSGGIRELGSSHGGSQAEIEIHRKWNFEGSWPRQGLLGSAKYAGHRPCIAAEAAGEAVKLKGG